MTIHNKLIRDKIPEIIEKNGAASQTRVLNDEEFKEQLLIKLLEEGQEVKDAKDSKEELSKEIGDVLEVIEAIIVAFGLDKTEIEALKKERKETRGGFEKKLFLESSEE